jgi:hypothetical protein
MRRDRNASLLAWLTRVGQSLGLVRARPAPAAVAHRAYRSQIPAQTRYRRGMGTDLGSGGCITQLGRMSGEK